MRKNVTYEKSVIYGTALAKHTPPSSMATDVIYGRSVIASEAAIQEILRSRNQI